MSASWTDTLQRLRAWRRARLPHGVFLGAALTLAVASSLGEPPDLGLLWRPAVAYVALAAFRLWDDLEDRELDQVRDPSRVKLEPPQRIAAGVLLGVLLAALACPGILGLALGLLLFYRLRPGPWEPVLLLKYPALVLLLHGRVDGPALGAAALIYGAMVLEGHTQRRGALLGGVFLLLILLYGLLL